MNKQEGEKKKNASEKILKINAAMGFCFGFWVLCLVFVHGFLGLEVGENGVVCRNWWIFFQREKKRFREEKKRISFLVLSPSVVSVFSRLWVCLHHVLWVLVVCVFWVWCSGFI